MAKKKIEEDKEEEYEDDSFSEEVYTCRLCKENFEAGEGDDMISICDNCVENKDINVDKIWAAYDKGKISDDDLKSFDVAPYSKK